MFTKRASKDIGEKRKYKLVKYLKDNLKIFRASFWWKELIVYYIVSLQDIRWKFLWRYTYFIKW